LENLVWLEKEVREKFRRVKPLKEISVAQRGESKTPKNFGAGRWTC
jgi:hypothetical protein